MQRTYSVSCLHPEPEKTLDKMPAYCHRAADGQWYADLGPYGYTRGASSPLNAIMVCLLENGCTLIDVQLKSGRSRTHH